MPSGSYLTVEDRDRILQLAGATHDSGRLALELHYRDRSPVRRACGSRFLLSFGSPLPNGGRTHRWHQREDISLTNWI